MDGIVEVVLHAAVPPDLLDPERTPGGGTHAEQGRSLVVTGRDENAVRRNHERGGGIHQVRGRPRVAPEETARPGVHGMEHGASQEEGLGDAVDVEAHGRRVGRLVVLRRPERASRLRVEGEEGAPLRSTVHEIDAAVGHERGRGGPLGGRAPPELSPQRPTPEGSAGGVDGESISLGANGVDPALPHGGSDTGAQATVHVLGRPGSAHAPELVAIIDPPSEQELLSVDAVHAEEPPVRDRNPRVTHAHRDTPGDAQPVAAPPFRDPRIGGAAVPPRSQELRPIGPGWAPPSEASGRSRRAQSRRTLIPPCDHPTATRCSGRAPP